MNVVRQTISKWEQGRSVPDSELLLALSEVLETPVSTLLGEGVEEQKADDPETAVLGTAFHSLEWIFVRIAPAVLIGAAIGIVVTRRKTGRCSERNL